MATRVTKPLAVGSTIYYFDSNHRVYERADWFRSGGPIRRHHWRPVVITGETSRSWIVGERHWNQKKCPKKGYNTRQWALSQAEVDADCYVAEHAHRIARVVQTLRDAAVLQQVATLVGYVAPPERQP